MKNPENKIKSLKELKKIIENFKKEGKKIVLCHGVFDLFHPGHLLYFEAAKKEGDILIVSLTADQFVNKGINRPVFSHFIRAKVLATLEIVDYVIIDFHKTAVELVKETKPDIYFKGQEGEKELNDKESNLFKEAQAVSSVGGEIKFSYTPTYSSTELLVNYFNLYPKKTKEFLEDFKKKYSFEKIWTFIERVKKLKILIIGESIIDDYCYCQTMNKVSKANIVGTKYLKKEIFAGGVLASANHLANFCERVDLITVLGEKRSFEDFIKNKLKPNIHYKFFYEKNGQTIIKRRFFDPAFMDELFEIYYLDDRNLSLKTKEKILNHLEKKIKNYDLVIVKDYGHGFFDEELIRFLEKKAKFLALMVQTNFANYGFNLVTKYKRADFVCLDHDEARLAVHLNDKDIKEVGKKLLEEIKVENLIITLGHNGSLAFESKKKIYSCPVFSNKVIDRLGAGDAFVSVTAPLVSLKTPLEIVNFIGNVAGAIKVTIVGNKESVSKEKLYSFLKTILK